MNKSVLITGANSGIGKDVARQMALLPQTEKVFLGCRNMERAKEAKASLEKQTGKKIFEIVQMDVSSIDSVRKAVATMKEPVDAVVLNAGGMGGKTPREKTKEGVMTIFASNVLGHVVLVEEMLKANLINNVVLYAGSEAARGIKKMGIKVPQMKTYSIPEFESILTGEFFGKKMDLMEAYSYVKYTASLWIASLARQNPRIRFISMSPGGTQGTAAMDDMPPAMRFMYKYIAMPYVMPMLGMAHNLETGAKRFVDGINSESFSSGVFYGSKPKTVTGPVMDQSIILPDFKNQTYQDNANAAIHRFVN